MATKLTLEYDGTDFRGWAAQPGLRSVQGVLTSALATVLRVPEDGVRLVVAGRTDAGVHASGQVAHVDLTEDQLAALTRRHDGTAEVDAVARLLVDRLAADGINLLSSTGEAAGQEVVHLHVHVVPRYADEPGLRQLVNAGVVSDGELDSVYRQIKAGA